MKKAKIKSAIDLSKENLEAFAAQSQAKAQLESIINMVDALNDAGHILPGGNGNIEAEEDAAQSIREDALSVEVRSDWHEPGTAPDLFSEYNILLCTGGPAVRIIGDLSKYSEPETARIEYQDWGTPWTNYPITHEQQEKVLTYCRQFYFGE